MKENLNNKIVINNPDSNVESYRTMLNWIYTGECQLSENVLEIVPLIGLTDEYLLPDLMKICEDQILTYMDSKAACEILTNPSMLLPMKCDSSVRDMAKTVFLEEYERLEELYPDLE